MADRDDLRWDDPALVEPVDRRSPWRAGCRWLQSRWRQEQLGLRCGPHDPLRTDRFVASQLPVDAPRGSNFLSQEAVVSAEQRLLQKDQGGLVSEDRLVRNLLSSQPLCFNLFGHLQHHPEVLVAWIASLGIDAVRVDDVRIEWAPPRSRHFGGGSAFDALIIYESERGTKGFVGVECKYAEDLSEQRIRPRQPYLDYTFDSGHWRTGAAERLRRAETVQLWLNTLLAQSCEAAREEGWDEGSVVMLTCGADQRAFAATIDVCTELVDPPRYLRWSSYEALIDLAAQRADLVEWAHRFRSRYLNFEPVADLLAPDDPRRRHSRRAVIGDSSVVGEGLPRSE